VTTCKATCDNMKLHVSMLSRIPPVLLLLPCTSSRGLRHRPLGVTELFHYAHLNTIPLISNFIHVPSVHHCFVGYCSHVCWSGSTCALLFRLSCIVHLLLQVSPHVFVRGVTSLFGLGYSSIFLETCLFWASSRCQVMEVLCLSPIIYST
jgi:hypothetical protein